MGHRWWKRRRLVEGERILELVPRTLVEARESIADGVAQVVLLEPRFHSGPFSRWLQSRLPPERAHVEVRLEAFGSTIWRLLDGRRNLAEIMCAFVAAHPDQADQASERVWLFLQELERHGFVSLQQEATPPTRVE
ncbi:MAG: PqqD family protein [bacterium]|nr:PqqD family protein [bacterium]